MRWLRRKLFIRRFRRDRLVNLVSLAQRDRAALSPTEREKVDESLRKLADFYRGRT